MSASVDVVAAVIQDVRGRVLIGQRPSHKRHGGLWEFPGGKVHEGETLADAVTRELHEELGLTVTWIAAEPLYARQDPGQPFRILFLEASAQGDPVLKEDPEGLPRVLTDPLSGGQRAGRSGADGAPGRGVGFDSCAGGAGPRAQ